MTHERVDFKTEMIAGLRAIAHTRQLWGGSQAARRATDVEALLATSLADYFVAIPGEGWDGSIHKHLMDAFIAFQTDDKWSGLRGAYRIHAGCSMPDFLEAGLCYREQVFYTAALLVGAATASHAMREQLVSYFAAERCCVEQAWCRFVCRAYRPLICRLRAERHNGNRGDFGTTTLLTYATSGTVEFTFRRSTAREITCVANVEDLHGHLSCLGPSKTLYTECVAMFDDVTAHWDIDRLVRSDEGLNRGRP